MTDAGILYIFRTDRNLFNTQWLTLQKDIEKAMDRLSGLNQKLEERLSGIVTRGRTPTRQSLESQCRDIWSRRHLKRIIDIVMEEVFKEMKDRHTGSWWPLFHWTDSKIKGHGLYCTTALLLRALAYRRVRRAGLGISMKRMLSELHAIREVVNVYPRKRRQKVERQQSVLTKTSGIQQKLISILALGKEPNTV